MALFCFQNYSLPMKNNKTNFAITGAAALFVGLAGTSQAIPISPHAAQSIIQSSANKTPTGLAALVLRISAQAKKAGKKTKPVPSLSSSSTLGVIPMPSLTMPVVSMPIVASGLVIQPILPAASPVSSVPDGGTAGAMLGGTFGGLALLRKKLKT
jgi:hypothetical protein